MSSWIQSDFLRILTFLSKLGEPNDTIDRCIGFFGRIFPARHYDFVPSLRTLPCPPVLLPSTHTYRFMLVAQPLVVPCTLYQYPLLCFPFFTCAYPVDRLRRPTVWFWWCYLNCDRVTHLYHFMSLLERNGLEGGDRKCKTRSILKTARGYGISPPQAPKFGSRFEHLKRTDPDWPCQKRGAENSNIHGRISEP